MEEEVKKLTKLFQNIKSKGWIECHFKGDGQCGRLFEELIGNSENSFEIPDFYGIEIKTKQSSKEKYVTLFSYTPEGKYILEAERIKNTYGYPDKEYPMFNVLNASIYNNMTTIIGNKFIFFPTIDELNKKIILKIYDMNLNLLEDEIHWDFNVIYEKLLRKLTYLAFIDAERKYNNGKVYYRYNEIKFYKLKSINNFINAFKICKIRITFKLNIYKYGSKKGKIHDHGTSFDLRTDKIGLLYNEIK